MTGIKIRYLTPAVPLQGEGMLLARMLERGIEAVHLRHPECDYRELRRVLEEIPRDMHSRVALHDWHEMALDYGCMVHLNGRHPEPPAGWDGIIGRSCHSLDEVERSGSGRGECDRGKSDYVTLSPFFDSISKPGYRGVEFEGERLRTLAATRRIYALGGITPERLGALSTLGLQGAVLSGYITGEGGTEGIIRRVDETLSVVGEMDAETDSGDTRDRCAESIRRDSRMQFITHRIDRYDEIEGARLALAGGCRWIQLRMKDAPVEVVAENARRLAPICHACGARLILDDHVGLVRETGADGVHLGREDMPVEEARALLGDHYIIGATANTEDDIIRACTAGADYIGLGPFRFTTTKKRLSAVLGLEGYQRIMATVRGAGIQLPVVAIGGITLADLHPLMQTGVDGIAISGSVLRAPDPVEYTQFIIHNS